MPKIDFEAKTDRELLILNTQQTNEISEKLDELNGTVKNHSNRIVKLEVIVYLILLLMGGGAIGTNIAGLW